MKKNILTSEGMMEEIIIICTVSQGLWMKGSVQVYKSFFMMDSVILSWQNMECNHFRLLSQQLMKVCASFDQMKKRISWPSATSVGPVNRIKHKEIRSLSMAAHTCNPIVWEAETGR